jgi:hypothetical protein
MGVSLCAVVSMSIKVCHNDTCQATRCITEPGRMKRTMPQAALSLMTHCSSHDLEGRQPSKSSIVAGDMILVGLH